MISLESGTALTLLLAIIAAAVGYGRLQNRDENQGKSIDCLETWKKEHEKDADLKRTFYETRMTAFEVRLGKGEEKFDGISRDLIEIKNDLRTLLGRRRDDREKGGD